MSNKFQQSETNRITFVSVNFNYKDTYPIINHEHARFAKHFLTHVTFKLQEDT
jgi:hypothetical protein